MPGNDKDISQPPSLKPHKYALLLGAGFTKNFGGFLASEMWATIFNQKEIQQHPHLRVAMSTIESYEELYGKVVERQEGFSAEERATFLTAIQRAHEMMDAVIADSGTHAKTVFGNFCSLVLPKFQGSDKAPGFIFTIDQDLWWERHTLGGIQPYLPWVQRQQQLGAFGSPYANPLDPARDLVKLPATVDPSTLLAFNCPLYYIKLHGSLNFLSAIEEGRRVVITGTQKEDGISREPLLKAYWKLFTDVLSAGGVKLLIIGYGCQDQHINDLLFNCHRDHKLEISFYNPTDPWLFKKSLREPDGNALWHNMSGYFPFDIAALMEKEASYRSRAWQDLQRHFFT